MSDLREALESAYEEDEKSTEEASADLETANDKDNEDLSTSGAATDVENASDSEEDDDELTTSTENNNGKTAEELAAEQAQADADDQTQEKLADHDVKVEKPPVGWSPKNREHWANLPNELKVQINKREREVNQVLQSSAGARRLEQAFNQVVDPYRSAMVAQGVENPLQAIDGLMKTAATLGMGTPQQKAQRIAELIGHYGVDIQTLDSVLAGVAPQQQDNSQSQQINQAVNQALQPFIQQQQQAALYEQQQLNQTVNNKIQAIESREFFNDVRMDMADIMEMASKRGQVVTLEQAYDRAIQMNPEISGVIAAREQAKGLKDKQRAAASVNGRRGGTTAPNADMSMHEMLSRAWDGDLD